MRNTRRFVMFVRLQDGPAECTDVNGNAADEVSKYFDVFLQSLTDSKAPIAYSREFAFYDWELNLLSSGVTVADIPKPGVLITAPKQDNPFGYALDIKTRLKARCPPWLSAFLSSQEEEIVQIKPSFYGVTVNLKALWQRVFRTKK